MNELTLAIHAKGHSLTSFLNLIGFSLRWYYTHCHKGSARYEFLKSKVNEL